MSISPGMLHVVAAALDASEDLVAVFDVDPDVACGLRFADASDAFQRFSGYSRALLIGQPLGMLVAPEGRSALQKIEAAVSSQVPVRGDLLCIERDGRRLWLGYHLMPAPTLAAPLPGEHPRFVLIGRDITGRRAEADQARMIQGLLAKSFMLAEVPLAIVTPDGHFLMTNRCFDRLLGHPEGSLAGKPSFDTVGPQSRPPLKAARDRQMATGAPYDADIELLAADGGVIPVRLASAIVERSDRQRFRVLTLHPYERPPADRKQEEHFVASSLAFISLEEIKAALGDRWSSVASRVLETAERMIRKRLELGDLLSCRGERGFTIRFAQADEVQARLRAASIARDVRQHLIGHGEDPDHVEMQVTVARCTIAPDEPGETQILRRLDSIEAATLRAERTGSRPPRVRPIYNAASGTAVGLHVRAAGRVGMEGGIVFPETTFDQDIAALQKATELPQDRAGQMVFLDVGFDTFLGRPKTERYLELCARIAPTLRQTLVFLLSPLPNGVTGSLLHDVTRRLRPFCSGIGCHLAELGPPPIDLRLVPMSVVTIEAQGWKPGAAFPAERLRRLTAMLHVHQTRFMALEVEGPGTRQALHEAGTTWLTNAERNETSKSPLPFAEEEGPRRDVVGR